MTDAAEDCVILKSVKILIDEALPKHKQANIWLTIGQFVKQNGEGLLLQVFLHLNPGISFSQKYGVVLNSIFQHWYCCLWSQKPMLIETNIFESAGVVWHPLSCIDREELVSELTTKTIKVAKIAHLYFPVVFFQLTFSSKQAGLEEEEPKLLQPRWSKK